MPYIDAIIIHFLPLVYFCRKNKWHCHHFGFSCSLSCDIGKINIDLFYWFCAHASRCSISPCAFCEVFVLFSSLIPKAAWLSTLAKWNFFKPLLKEKQQNGKIGKWLYFKVYWLISCTHTPHGNKISHDVGWKSLSGRNWVCHLFVTTRKLFNKIRGQSKCIDGSTVNLILTNVFKLLW